MGCTASNQAKLVLGSGKAADGEMEDCGGGFAFELQVLLAGHGRFLLVMVELEGLMGGDTITRTVVAVNFLLEGATDHRKPRVRTY